MAKVTLRRHTVRPVAVLDLSALLTVAVPAAARVNTFSHTGGASSPSTYTDVWVLCADDGV